MEFLTKVLAFILSLSFSSAFVPVLHSSASVRCNAGSSDVETYKKQDFINSIADKTGMSKKESEEALKAVIDTIQEQVNLNKRVALPGFGVFSLRERAARNGRNPQTGEPLKIAASKAPGFSASKTWKDAVKGIKA